MEDETIDIILENIRDIETIDTVHFAPMFGDPLTSSKLIRFIDRIKEIRSDIFITILTNGKGITPEFIKAYNGDHICISILGNRTKSPTYEEITGLKWENLHNIAYLVNAVNISYNFNLHVYSVSDVTDVLSDLKKLPNLKVIYGITGTAYDSETLLQQCYNINQFYGDVRLNNFVYEYDNTIKSTDYKYKDVVFPKIEEEYSGVICPLLYRDCFIDSNGNVLVCGCMDYSMQEIADNIKNESILKIYNNKIMEFNRNNKTKQSLCYRLCGKQ